MKKMLNSAITKTVLVFLAIGTAGYFLFRYFGGKTNSPLLGNSSSPIEDNDRVTFKALADISLTPESQYLKEPSTGISVLGFTVFSLKKGETFEANVKIVDFKGDKVYAVHAITYTGTPPQTFGKMVFYAFPKDFEIISVRKPTFQE